MTDLVNKPLTDKQEAACQAYIEVSGNQSEAYRRAYNTENMTQRTIWTAASELFRSPHVTSRVLKLLEEHRERHNVTVDTITVELDEARDLARVEKLPAAMTGAVMGKAKIHGLITEKSKVDLTSSDGTMTPSVLDMSKLSTQTIKELLSARESAKD